MGFRVVDGKLIRVELPGQLDRNPATVNADKKDSFDKLFKEKLQKDKQFTMSNHASERLKTRNISLNETDMKRINEGINKAQNKGAKDCLILYKDVAMVASVKNRTIITAVDKESCKGNVFTNIDSVVLL